MPAHSVPSEACATAPIVWTFSSGQIDAQLLPPSVVFQMPPPETAANAVFGVKRSATTSVTRPPMLYGPSCFHERPLAVPAGATAAAWLLIWSTCARVTSELELSLKSANSSGVAPFARSAASFSGGSAATSVDAFGGAGVVECVKATVRIVAKTAATPNAAVSDRRLVRTVAFPPRQSSDARTRALCAAAAAAVHVGAARRSGLENHSSPSLDHSAHVGNRAAHALARDRL